MNDGLEPETVDVILENRKLTAERAALRQQLAEARAEVERQNRQLTPYRNCDSGYIRLVPHGEDVTAWLDNGRWEKVDGWGELGPLQNLQFQCKAHHAANDEVEIVGLDRYELTDELAALRQQLAEVNKNWQDAEAHIKLCNKIHAERCRLHDEANEQLAAQAADLERLRGVSHEHKFQLGLTRGLLARSQRAFKLVNAAFLHGAKPDENTAEGERQIEAIVELHDCSTDIAHYWYSHVQRESDHAYAAQATTDNPRIP